MAPGEGEKEKEDEAPSLGGAAGERDGGKDEDEDEDEIYGDLKMRALAEAPAQKKALARVKRTATWRIENLTGSLPSSTLLRTVAAATEAARTTVTRLNNLKAETKASLLATMQKEAALTQMVDLEAVKR